MSSGSFIANVTASSEGYESATIRLTIVIPPLGSVLTDWRRADVKLDNTPIFYDSKKNRVYFSIGAGFSSPSSFIAEVTYNSIEGYEIGIDRNEPVPSGAQVEFENLTYDSVHKMQLYKNSRRIEEVEIIFSNLPVVNIDARKIVDEPDEPGVFQLSSYEFAEIGVPANMGIEFRGSSSQAFTKKQYGLDFTDLPISPPGQASKQNQQFLDLRSDDDWILDASFRDTTFVRNLINHSIWNDLRGYAYIDSNGDEKGQASIRGYLTELILNDEYRGVYVLNEEVDRKLLDLKEVDVPIDDQGVQQWSLVDFTKPENGSVLYKPVTNFATFYRAQPNEVMRDFEVEYPDYAHYDPLQKFIEFVVNSSDAEFAAGIEDWIHLDNLVDFWLLAVVGSSADTLKKNYFVYKSGGGKFYFMPWDWDASYAMWWTGDFRSSLVNWWADDKNLLFYRLLTNPLTGFNALLAQRWEELRFGLLSIDSIVSRFEQYNLQVVPNPANKDSGPYARNKTRWGDSGGEGLDHPELREIDFLRNWLVQRHQVVTQRIEDLEK